MRNLIVTENMSLDGVVAPMDGWFDPAAQDDDLVEATTRHMHASDALVLGRVTYEEFVGFWPKQVGSDSTGIAEYLDRVAKYVVSSTLQRADWAGTTGTDWATYTRQSPGMSAFALEDGVVYHTYSAYSRGVDGLWGMYQWLDRAPKGRNEADLPPTELNWFKRRDEYGST